MSEQEAPQAARLARVRVLLGMHVSDFESSYRHTPTIIGAMDMGIWEIAPPEETDAIFAKWKREFSDDWAEYEWREVEIEVDPDALRASFDSSRITARGVSPASPSGGAS